MVIKKIVKAIPDGETSKDKKLSIVPARKMKIEPLDSDFWSFPFRKIEVLIICNTNRYTTTHHFFSIFSKAIAFIELKYR